MRKLIFVALLLISFMATSTKVSATEIPIFDQKQIEPLILAREEPKPPPKPVEYIVESGDNLTTISKAHNVPLDRLWAKNTHIDHPDQLKPGDRLILPNSNEKLELRPFPTKVVVSSNTKQVPVIRNLVSSGNSYSPGYCTWYVKNYLRWVPNGWSNANQWAYWARSQGYTVSSVPTVGSVAQTSAGGLGHVAAVIAVGKGTVTITEMNYLGRYVVSSRTVPTSSFVYIR